MNKRLKKKHKSKTERKETQMQNIENLIPDDGIDRSVYEEPYVVKEGCLCEEVMTKAGTGYIKLCDYVPVLRKEITFDDGTELKKLFLISAKHASGILLPEVLVSADEMQNMKWPIIKWGALGAAEPRKNALAKMCHAIMMTKRESVSVETIYRQTGWRKVGGRYVFLMPNDNSALKVELPGKLSCYRFVHESAESDIKYLAQLLENPFAPARIVYPLLALVFLSPLNHFMRAAHCESKTVTALVGKTVGRRSGTIINTDVIGGTEGLIAVARTFDIGDFSVCCRSLYTHDIADFCSCGSTADGASVNGRFSFCDGSRHGVASCVAAAAAVVSGEAVAHGCLFFIYFYGEFLADVHEHETDQKADHSNGKGSN